MRMIRCCMKPIKRHHFALPLLVGLIGCGISPVLENDGRVYHCVATSMPYPPAYASPKKQPLERFEYGDFVRVDRPTTGHATYCNFLRVPGTAYLRYRYEGNLIEKRFDLSSLPAWRRYDKTVEFFVDGETVDVRLITFVRGNPPITEVIVRQ